jgi:hypothetical protein
LRTLGVDSKALEERLLGVSNRLNGLYSQTQLLTAAYDVASAGFANAADNAKVLEAAAKGATGGLSDINTVGNAVTSVLNAYGKSANNAAVLVDGFIQTQNDGKIILNEYAQLIGRLAPTAAAANVGINELNAAVATITAQGVPAEATFTGLNQALISILKPSAEATELAKKLGIDKYEAVDSFLESYQNTVSEKETLVAELSLTKESLVDKEFRLTALSAGVKPEYLDRAVKLARTELTDKVTIEQAANKNLESAKSLTLEAAKLVQKGPHKSATWKLAQEKRQQGVKMLEAIPPDSILYADAQSRLKSYRAGLIQIAKVAELQQTAESMAGEILSPTVSTQLKQLKTKFPDKQNFLPQCKPILQREITDAEARKVGLQIPILTEYLCAYYWDS